MRSPAFEYAQRWPDLWEPIARGDEELARALIQFTEEHLGAVAPGPVAELVRFFEAWAETRDLGPMIDVVAALEQRDKDLEDYLGSGGFGGQTFHQQGLVTIQESDPWYPRTNFAPQAWVASLDAYGSGTATVELRKAGVAVDTINLTSVGPVEAALSDEWGALADSMTVAVTAAGVACRGLVCTVYP